MGYQKKLRGDRLSQNSWTPCLSDRLRLPGSRFSSSGLITLNWLRTFSYTEHTNILPRKHLPCKTFPSPLQKQQQKAVFCHYTSSNSFPVEWWRQSGHCSRKSLPSKVSKCVLDLRVGLCHIIPWSFTVICSMLFFELFNSFINRFLGSDIT